MAGRQKYRSTQVVTARQILEDEETVITQDGPVKAVKTQWEVFDRGTVIVLDDADFAEQFEAEKDDKRPITPKRK